MCSFNFHSFDGCLHHRSPIAICRVCTRGEPLIANARDFCVRRHDAAKMQGEEEREEEGEGEGETETLAGTVCRRYEGRYQRCLDFSRRPRAAHNEIKRPARQRGGRRGRGRRASNIKRVCTRKKGSGVEGGRGVSTPELFVRRAKTRRLRSPLFIIKRFLPSTNLRLRDPRRNGIRDGPFAPVSS